MFTFNTDGPITKPEIEPNPEEISINSYELGKYYWVNDGEELGKFFEGLVDGIIEYEQGYVDPKQIENDLNNTAQFINDSITKKVIGRWLKKLGNAYLTCKD